MSATPPRLVLGHCLKCGGGQKLVGPLHLDKGGPILCLPCGIEWHAEQARSRNRAEMKKRFMDMAFGGTAYAGPHELTLELLEEAVRLTHPDRHPPERAEQATRVTAELLALKPYVLSKPPPPPPSNTSATATPWQPQTSVTPEERKDWDEAGRGIEALLKRIRPCEICRDTVPLYYCDACRDWHEAQQRKARELDNAKRERDNKLQRARRAWRRRLSPPGRCAACGTAFKGKRKDAKYCSAACRQRAHRSCHATRDSRVSAEADIKT
jgi:hypothetical protein